MVGGMGNRRDEGSVVINNTNVFAALETLRKKKKSDKDKLPKSKPSSSSSARGKGSQLPQQQQVFWAPAPLKAKSWADVDDDEDDDYYATNAPPPSVWGKTAAQQEEEHSHEINDNNMEDTESDEDILDEVDEELEEEHENEPDVMPPEPVVNKPAESADVSVATKDADRQLSRKERKKKELAELEALLADFGVAPPKESNGQNESGEVLHNKKDGEPDGEVEKKDNAPGESKTAKKKKKKEKSSKEAKDAQDQPNNLDTQNGAEENPGTEQAGENGSSVDMKERLKKMASTKKKKTGKEVDAAAKAAGQEAAARSAKLAAAKKKEKNHYNQQPVR